MAVWLTIIALAMVFRGTGSLSFTLDRHDEQCFSIYLDIAEQCNGNYEVLKGGLKDVNVQISGPMGKIYYSAESERMGNFQFDAKDTGSYKVCFDNNVKKKAVSKTVVLAIHHSGSVQVASAEQTNGISEDVAFLNTALITLLDELQFVQARSRALWEATESTGESVLFSQAIELLVMLILTAWQVFRVHLVFNARQAAGLLPL